MKLANIVAVFAASLGSVVFSASAEEIKAKGSDSTMPLLKALAEEYQKSSGNVVTLEGGGSSKGAEACIAGTAQLCFLSRDLKDAEKEAGLVPVNYAFDGVAVIVNKQNPVEDVSIDQLREIYTAKMTQWQDGKPLVMFNRNADSGTRECFSHAVMNKEEFSDKAAVKHDGVILSSVAKIPTAVAYTSAGEVNETVKVVKVNGVEPSPEKIRDKSYPICRALNFATKGEPSTAVKAFMDFCMSEAGQRVVAAHHYVPVMESVQVQSVASGEQAGSN